MLVFAFSHCICRLSRHCNQLSLFESRASSNFEEYLLRDNFMGIVFKGIPETSASLSRRLILLKFSNALCHEIHWIGSVIQKTLNKPASLYTNNFDNLYICKDCRRFLFCFLFIAGYLTRPEFSFSAIELNDVAETSTSLLTF